MAKEIRETPILRGKDAVRFEKAIKANENRKVSHDEFQRGKKAYETIPFVDKQTN